MQHHHYFGPTGYSVGTNGTLKNEANTPVSTPVSLVNNRINSLNGTLGSSVKRASNNSIGQNNPNVCYFCQRGLTSHQAMVNHF